MSDILNDFFKWYKTKKKHKSILSNKLFFSKSEKLNFSSRNSSKIKINENNNNIIINKKKRFKTIEKNRKPIFIPKNMQ